MFRSVLVANRGEIAVRVLRACRELDITSVAVYSEADRDAPWLAHADEAYLLGPAPAAESYLNIERILDVAERSGARAVHPGYGFLAENAAFAEAVTEAGLTWIGPPAAAITAMGDKLSARAAARAADCPVVPGTMEPTDDPDVVRAFAAEHGFPVAIKAAFGGGGRGLKVVREERELAEALEGAQREAMAAFGRGEVYVERYLTRPRHIEIQVLADTHGTVLHLGERDCSTQRRHQKLIEEAPAPGLDETVRKAMGEAAIRVSREVGYVGAGTCEFLYTDPEARDPGAPPSDEATFYFLEMNTRLQVEHPVTELVTGIDLVHWQFRVAAGEPLDFGQDDVRMRGHAIEARVNAENVAANFAPAPGRITAWQVPSGPGVRVDAGAQAGWDIPRDYDSLIAKVIGFGADREDARRKLLRACREMVVQGVPTTLDFHTFALSHPDFVAGNVSTVSVEREWDLSGIAAPEAPVEGSGAPAPSRSVTVEVAGKRFEVTLFEADGAGDPPQRQRRRQKGERSQARRHGTATEILQAPMQGTIVKTAVEIGDAVSAGDLVLVLEAMKMENHITAHRDGIVRELHVGAGDVVNSGEALATITGAGDAPADSTGTT